MFSDILNQYNPKDKQSHGILKFFAEDLDEIERIKFVETIFERGSWILPTEISKLSKSKELKEQTEHHFFRIFNDWVNARIDYSESIAIESKHPFVTIKLSSEFSEVILSLRNLDFSDKIMPLFKKFLEQANANYLNTFLDRNYFLIVEEYKINEIEFLFDFFLGFYYQNLTKRSSDFIYNFLNSLAFSDKIYSLSQSFIEKLRKLSLKLKESEYKSDYTLLIALLLIDLIKRKKLDLSMSIYSPLIEETLEALDKGNHDNLDFYRFLKRFNYSFNNYNVKIDANAFFNKINDSLIRLESQNNLQKQNTLHLFIQSSFQYFELLLFYLEKSSEDQAREFFLKFIAFVDVLRKSFSSLLWFDEYLNFNIIKGRVVSKIQKGYEVKIETRYFYEKIKEKQIDLPLSDDFVFKYGFGFLPEKTLNNSPEEKKAYSSLKNINSETLSKQFSQEDENTELQSYFISNLNYSITNKLKVIILIPIGESKPIQSVIYKYQLKAFYSFIELFLIDKAFHYLNLDSPLPKLKRGLKHLLTPPHFIDNYKIGLTEDSFWGILRETKPLLYDSIYIRHKNNEKSFKEIQFAFDNNITVSGVISSKAKGGMNVDVFGLQGFLPGSQIEVGKVIDYDVYIGQTMEFKIIKINLDYNFVISHKILFNIESEKRKQVILDQLHKGQILEGKVKNITSYGAFVDLGEIDGLIHMSELSWIRLKSPNDVLKLNQNIKVIVLDFDEEKKRIELSFKQLLPDPWDLFDPNIRVGDRIKGEVVEIADFGAFLEIIPGIEGLIHVSEMTWNKNLKKARSHLQIGDIIEAVILTINREEKKISMGLKQLIPNPWENV